jgi:hypothetical protein
VSSEFINRVTVSEAARGSPKQRGQLTTSHLRIYALPKIFSSAHLELLLLAIDEQLRPSLATHPRSSFTRLLLLMAGRPVDRESFQTDCRSKLFGRGLAVDITHSVDRHDLKKVLDKPMGHLAAVCSAIPATRCSN